MLVKGATVIDYTHSKSPRRYSCTPNAIFTRLLTGVSLINPLISDCNWFLEGKLTHERQTLRWPVFNLMLTFIYISRIFMILLVCDFYYTREYKFNIGCRVIRYVTRTIFWNIRHIVNVLSMWQLFTLCHKQQMLSDDALKRPLSYGEYIVRVKATCGIS